MKYSLLSLVSILLIANSPSSSADEFEQHGAHDHGSARLNVALDDSVLYLELESPAVNVVGFEHVPMNDEETAQLNRAKVLLQSPENLFFLPASADCRLVELDVDSSLFTGATEHRHDDSEEDHAVENVKGHENERGHEDGHEDEEGHADIHATYHFECSKPQQLSHVELKLFSTFPQTRDIDAQVISPNGQTQQELSPANTKIEL